MFSSGKKAEDTAGPIVPLAEEAFRDLIFSVEEKELRARLPDLARKKSLEISPRQKSFSGILVEKGASCVLRLGGTKEREAALPSETFVLSHWENLPLLNQSADFILMRTAFLKGSLGRLLREVSRIMTPSGGVLFSDLHPFSVMVQKDHLKNPVGEEGLGPGFERYYKWFRDAGLRVDSVKELFFEGSLKKFFSTDEQKKFFDQTRRTPFLIFFTLRKDS